MNLRGLSRRPVLLSDWQNNARVDIAEQYEGAVKEMYRLDTLLRQLNNRLSFFKEDTDSADRPILFFCEPEKPKKRVELKAKKVFLDEEIRPVSREFRAAMIKVRDLHFQCRNTKVEVPKSTFDFLLSWGIVKPAATKKNTSQTKPIIS